VIPYAILGTNWISGEFYAASLCSDLELRGICSRTRETGQAFAHKIGRPDTPVYPGVEDLAAAPDIEAVYIASPNSLHAPQSEVLLRAGKHVLCEKPIVTRPQDLERLQALARESGLVYMEAIMYLCTPARRAVKQALPELGEITSAHFDFSQLSSRYDELAAGDIPNVFLPGMGGGAWNDLGIYCMYPALDFFFGQPQLAVPPLDIQAQTRLLPGGPGCSGVDGAGAALLQYPGAPGETAVSLGWNTGAPGESAVSLGWNTVCPVTLTWSKLGQSHGVSQIMGTKGTITIQSISQFQGITFHPRRAAPRELAPFEQNRHRDTMRHEARAFCDYIAARPAAVPYEESSALALAVARAMEDVRQAW